jgi:hypothetical protein
MSCIEEAVEFAKQNFCIAYHGIGLCHIVPLIKTKNVPSCIKTLRKGIIEQNNFEGWFNNPELCDHIVFVDDKADLKFHTDLFTLPHLKNYEHMRANWIVQKPIDGGKIIAKDVEFETKLNDVCLVNALEPHKVTKIIGEVPLILYTFGFIKEKDNV